jgi:hypothetical protein
MLTRVPSLRYRRVWFCFVLFGFQLDRRLGTVADYSTAAMT